MSMRLTDAVLGTESRIVEVVCVDAYNLCTKRCASLLNHVQMWLSVSSISRVL